MRRAAQDAEGRLSGDTGGAGVGRGRPLPTPSRTATAPNRHLRAPGKPLPGDEQTHRCWSPQGGRTRRKASQPAAGSGHPAHGLSAGSVPGRKATWPWARRSTALVHCGSLPATRTRVLTAPHLSTDGRTSLHPCGPGWARSFARERAGPGWRHPPCRPGPGGDKRACY